LLNRKIYPEEAERIIKKKKKRIVERIPVEYITHEAYYLGRYFYVDENVLVPRSLMSSQFTFFLEKVVWKNYRVLDLCAGSGCIGITLALLNPHIQVSLVDISSLALKVAQKNIQKMHLEDRVHCINSDLFENVHEKYDLIITNPPYVTQEEYRDQPEEVKNEPILALVAKEDGLAIVNRILKDAKKYLNPEGLLIAEVGYLGAKNLKKKYPELPLRWYKCRSTLGDSPQIDWFIPFVEWIIRYTGYLDSIFTIKASSL